MTRARTMVALAAAITLAATIGLPAAAQAAPIVAGPSVVAADATTGDVRVQVLYKPDGQAARKLSPNAEVEVTFWKLDTATGLYMRQADGTWTEGGPAEVDVSGPLEPGTYSVRFLAKDTSIGGQWWDAARYFYDAKNIKIVAGQSADLGVVTLTPSTLDVYRVSGADRFATAVAASQWNIPDGSAANVVYLTDGMNYPDALAAGPAAISHGGVLLLTQRNTLPAVTRKELVRVHPVRVVIVGGTGAVSNTVVNQVKAALPSAKVARLGGASRYETGELVVRDAFVKNGAGVAIIATGANYPDALAAGPAAGYMGAPVVLVDGHHALPQSTVQLLTDLGIEHAVILGGTGVVSASIESRVKKLVGVDNVLRIAGASRYQTAAQLNAAIFDPSDHAFVASGTNFPDALAGAPLAGAFQAPLFLTPPACLGSDATAGVIASRANGLVLLGGPGALSKAVEDLRVCP